MVCIQCYLPPILFMIYMKFLNPIIAPFLYPVFNKVVTYFWGPEAAITTEGACPMRTKPQTTKNSGDSNEPIPSTSSTKNKDD